MFGTVRRSCVWLEGVDTCAVAVGMDMFICRSRENFRSVLSCRTSPAKSKVEGDAALVAAARGHTCAQRSRGRRRIAHTWPGAGRATDDVLVPNFREKDPERAFRPRGDSWRNGLVTGF